MRKVGPVQVAVSPDEGMGHTRSVLVAADELQDRQAQLPAQSIAIPCPGKKGIQGRTAPFLLAERHPADSPAAMLVGSRTLALHAHCSRWRRGEHRCGTGPTRGGTDPGRVI
jgi:hypothetical protein